MPINSRQYGQEAAKIIKSDDVPLSIIEGGSPFYIKSVLQELQGRPPFFPDHIYNAAKVDA